MWFVFCLWYIVYVGLIFFGKVIGCVKFLFIYLLFFVIVCFICICDSILVNCRCFWWKIILRFIMWLMIVVYDFVWKYWCVFMGGSCRKLLMIIICILLNGVLFLCINFVVFFIWLNRFVLIIEILLMIKILIFFYFINNLCCFLMCFVKCFGGFLVNWYFINLWKVMLFMLYVVILVDVVIEVCKLRLFKRCMIFFSIVDFLVLVGLVKNIFWCWLIIRLIRCLLFIIN